MKEPRRRLWVVLGFAIVLFAGSLAIAASQVDDDDVESTTFPTGPARPSEDVVDRTPTDVAQDARAALASFRDQPFADRLSELAGALGISVEEARGRVNVLTAFDVPLPLEMLESAIEDGVLPSEWGSLAVYLETDDGYPFLIMAYPHTDIPGEIDGLVQVVRSRAERETGRAAYGDSFLGHLDVMHKNAASRAVILGFTEPASQFAKADSDKFSDERYLGFALQLVGGHPVKPTDDVYSDDAVAEFAALWDRRFKG